MSEIKISNLTFAYEGGYENIFENVSFSLDTDWRTGLIGRNGRGKTTLLKLLSGRLSEGSVYRGNIVSSEPFEYFPFDVGDAGTNKKVWELLDTSCEGLEYWRVCVELSQLSMDTGILERSFDTLSKGEQTRVMLAALFSKENNFLLIDEPTNHLDIEGRRILGKYLAKKRGFILVSHDRRFLNTCIDHVMSINPQDIEIVKGNFDSWYADKSARDESEALENMRLKSEIKRLSDSAGRAAGWSDRVEKTKTGNRISGVKADKGHIGHMAAKAMKRAKNIEARKLKAIEDKKGLLKNIETYEELKLMPLTFHKERLLEFKEADIGYSGMKGGTCETPVVRKLSFSVERGDKLVIRGRNGSGKSSIIRLILGESSSKNIIDASAASEPLLISGELYVAQALKISYVPQDTELMCGLPEAFIEGTDIDRTLFFSVLRKLDFDRDELTRDMRELSSGQKKKVMLAKSLCERAHLYIWDEPLNYVDIFSRIQLENMIRGTGMTMIFIEHDEEFAKNISNKTVEI